MLVFIVICIGMTINSYKTDTDDHFEHIFNGKAGSGSDDPTYETVLDKLWRNRACPISQKTGLEIKLSDDTEFTLDCNDTRFLLESLSYDKMLSSSGIWSQVLFSFLYWNKESKSSMKNLLSEYAKNVDKLVVFSSGRNKKTSVKLESFGLPTESIKRS